jgi:drug/metabolite transporter (DMT)-like permease
VNTAVSKINHNVAGIVCVIAGTMALGIQDMLIKVLSERYPYPLHQIGLFRSVVALALVFVFLWLEGGFRQIVTSRAGHSPVARRAAYHSQHGLFSGPVCHAAG